MVYHSGAILVEVVPDLFSDIFVIAVFVIVIVISMLYLILLFFYLLFANVVVIATVTGASIIVQV